MPNQELHFEEAIFDDASAHGWDYLEVPSSRRAFLLVAGFAVLLALLVLGRVGILNLNRAIYETRASANLSREISLPAYRAVITDRYGQTLTENTSSWSVFLHLPTVINAPSGGEEIFRELSQLLNSNEEIFRELVRKANLEENNWFPIARQITAGEAIAVRSLNLGGVEVLSDFKRRYAEGPAFAHILGYTGVGDHNEIIGKAGLELEYDELIRGKDGIYVFYEDASGEVLEERILRPPEASPPLALTLDAEFTRYFYRRLRQGLQELGRSSGVGIALNPQNGEILALVSFPSFDNNVFVDRSRNSERERLLKAAGEPLFNRAVSGVYSPGSTVKPLLALATLREGILDPETEIFSSGKLTIPNPYNPESPSIFLDWKPHGWVNLGEALARSSNIYFYLAGGGVPKDIIQEGLIRGLLNPRGLGIEKLNWYWRKFLWGEKTGVDLPFEGIGFLPDPAEKEGRTGEIWRLGDTYNVAIGQGDLLITPLQLLQFIVSLANGGKIYRPFLKKDLPSQLLLDYSDWTSEIKIVQSGMEEAVAKPYGTAYLLHDLPFKVAGKTGSAQIAGNTKTNAFFVGYGPLPNPEIAILVLIENAREGSLNALPIAKDIFQWYFDNRIQNSNDNL